MALNCNNEVSGAILFRSTAPFQLEASNGKTWDCILEYSTDGKTWNEWNGESISSGENNELYIRGTGNTVITGRFGRGWKLEPSADNKIECIGNIENLLDYRVVLDGKHPTMGRYCYVELFCNNTDSISKVPSLPAVKLTDGCYCSIFQNCTSLTQAPKLPAAILADWCYCDMFCGCTSLVQAPRLPALTLAPCCYNCMFFDCISLVRAPELPATVLATYCYNCMFQGCTSLVQVPRLPATLLRVHCYHSMFKNCSSIEFSETLTSECSNEYRVPESGTATNKTAALTSMFGNIRGTFQGTPEINTTYYTNAMVV